MCTGLVLLHVVPTEFQGQDTCELQTAWSQASLLFLIGLSGYLTHAVFLKATLNYQERSTARMVELVIFSNFGRNQRI